MLVVFLIVAREALVLGLDAGLTVFVTELALGCGFVAEPAKVTLIGTGVSILVWEFERG